MGETRCGERREGNREAREVEEAAGRGGAGRLHTRRLLAPTPTTPNAHVPQIGRIETHAGKHTHVNTRKRIKRVARETETTRVCVCVVADAEAIDAHA